MEAFDCVVIGSGHAGSCAALSAIEHGCRKVLMVDKCPAEWVGGNGYFTAGAHRTVHDGLADILRVVKDVPQDIAKQIDMDAYTTEEFTADIVRLGDGRSDPDLVRAVVEDSHEVIEWLAEQVRVPFVLSFNRQAYEVAGRQKFWGGLVLSVENGGKGLIDAHQRALKKAGVHMWFDTPATQLVVRDGRVAGVVLRRESEGGMEVEISASAVILAAGGFEASAALRTKHLGPAWKHARVRGTPYNTGDGFALVQGVGAQMIGDWAGCHSTAWDANAPSDAGQREMTNQFTKSGYPLGIMVNSRGERFVDEGEDFRNYTYAKFGRAILAQPGGIAFQVWDAKVLGHLRKEEYGEGVVEKIYAANMEDLAEKLVAKGLEDKQRFLETIRAFNDAVRRHREEHPEAQWDPAVKDGLSTQSGERQLELAKSNWALAIEQGPFMAVRVACGITFTFGGVAIEPKTAGVVSATTGAVIPGLFCTGEMVGGLFFGNYPGGSGLTAGAVFGRRAGRAAGSICSSVAL